MTAWFCHFRTLRFRLALLYLVVFGSIQIALCAVVLHAREDDLHQDFDRRLLDRAESMLDAIHLDADRVARSATTRRASPRIIPYRFPGYYFQFRAADGTVIERSRNLRRAALPLGAAARASRPGQPVLETLAGEAADAASGRREQLRLLTIRTERPNTEPFYLQVAAGLAPVRASVAELRRLVFLVVPAGLLAAAVVSWFMARRSLRPIRDIARETRAYTAAQLDRRLRSPPTRDEVAELVSVINGMLDRLQAAFQAQERFIANASHELKTPLSVLLTEAQLLTQQAGTSEEYSRFVANVQDELRQLSRLIDSLLTLARADAGFPLARAEPVSINDVLTDAVQRCEPAARRREVRLIPTLALPREDGCGPIVCGDAALLRILLENLLRNAIRHSPVEQTVDIEVALTPDSVAVAIRDLGPGIPAEHVPHLFDRPDLAERLAPFPRTDGPVGTGLGLAIARGVARLHGGSITATNRPTAGCEVTVTLPLHPQNRDLNPTTP